MNALFGARPLTPEEKARLEVRRAGNLLREARDRGWLARLGGPRPLCWVEFKRPDGKLLKGPVHRNAEGAVLLGALALEPHLKT